MVLRFDIITEADARQIERGATVELSRGGHVTPLAQDTLARAPGHGGAGRFRRSGAAGGSRAEVGHPPSGDCAAITPACKMRAAIVQHLRGRGSRSTIWAWTGPTPVDYPDTAGRGRASRWRVARRTPGSSIDGAGIGSAIAANKIRGIRAAMITDETIARYAREHNGTNVMTLGSTLLPDTQTRHPAGRHLAGHADDRSAVYSAAVEGPPARGVVLTRLALALATRSC